MNAADTSASSAIADCTPLTVVSRSRTTAAIDTFISDVSTTNTNIAMASRIANRRFSGTSTGTPLPDSVSHRDFLADRLARFVVLDGLVARRRAAADGNAWGTSAQPSCGRRPFLVADLIRCRNRSVHGCHGGSNGENPCVARKVITESSSSSVGDGAAERGRNGHGDHAEPGKDRGHDGPDRAGHPDLVVQHDGALSR